MACRLDRLWISQARQRQPVICFATGRLLAAVNIAISLTLSEQSGVLATAQPRSTFLIFAGVLALARMIWAERRRDASLILSMARRWALLAARRCRSEEHTSELQSLMRISYAVFCLKKKN